MTTTLQVGDRVQFRPDPLFAPRPDSFASGTVTDIVVQGRMQYALIRRDDNSIDWIDVNEVTPISADAIMRAVRAMPQDEAERESAISACKIADVVSDYTATMALGDMSAAELV